MDHVRRNYLDGLIGALLYGESQLGRKTDSPEDSESILRKAVHGFPHAPDDALLQILHTSEFIHKSRMTVIGHCIDGKIPAF